MSEPGAPPTPPPPGDPSASSSAPPPPPPAQSGNRELMIVLAYLGPLALIPLVVEKEDSEVQWHAKHGLVLFVAELILLTLLSIAVIIIGMVLPPVGCVTWILWPLLTLAILILHILCIVKGVGGERFLVPGVSQYADRF